MPRRISPIIERNWADIDAYAVSDAAIPVYSAGCSMNSKFLRGFNGTPDFVSVMFTYNLSFGLKIRVYRQKIHLIKSRKQRILGFLIFWFRKAFWLVRVNGCG